MLTDLTFVAHTEDPVELFVLLGILKELQTESIEPSTFVTSGDATLLPIMVEVLGIDETVDFFLTDKVLSLLSSYQEPDFLFKKTLKDISRKIVVPTITLEATEEILSSFSLPDFALWDLYLYSQTHIPRFFPGTGKSVTSSFFGPRIDVAYRMFPGNSCLSINFKNHLKNEDKYDIIMQQQMRQVFLREMSSNLPANFLPFYYDLTIVKSEPPDIEGVTGALRVITTGRKWVRDKMDEILKIFYQGGVK